MRRAGLEPARLAAPPPQDGVSANSTTSARSSLLFLIRRWCRGALLLLPLWVLLCLLSPGCLLPLWLLPCWLVACWLLPCRGFFRRCLACRSLLLLLLL